MKKILFVANVAKEHILKFHIPSIKRFKDEGWIVDVACSGSEIVPYCDHQYQTSWKRSPFSLKTFYGIIELTKIIQGRKYDVVYCHTPVGGLVARIAAKKSRRNGTRVVYFAHGFHFFKDSPVLNWLLYYPVEKILAKWTDVIITINSEDYENAGKMLKCHSVYQLPGMGIDIERFMKVDRSVARQQCREELNIPQNACIMIYLAELVPNKNQSMLLDTLKIVMEKCPNTYLLLAGIDHNSGKYQNYAQKIGVLEHVRFLGWRSDKEILYAASDICTASSIREGFGLNLVEAMASGLPVVATRNRGHETIIKDNINGYLVNIDDSDTMAQRVYDALKGNLFKESILDCISMYDEKYIVDKIVSYVLL